MVKNIAMLRASPFASPIVPGMGGKKDVMEGRDKGKLWQDAIKVSY